jgi:hypothetical protein
MRAKVAIPLLVIGILALLLPFIFRPKNPAADGQRPQVFLAVSQSTPKQSFTSYVGIPPGQMVVPPEKKVLESNMAANDSTDEDYEDQRIAELEDLGMTDDPGSLVTIESEFDNRDPRIQKAAVAAAVQFGSRDAIPGLEDAYTHFDDPEQKINIKKAIDFLKLPSISEASKASSPPFN